MDSNTRSFFRFFTREKEKKVDETTVFKSINHSKLLKKDGVIQIPFLDDFALQKIKSLYANEHPTGAPSSFFEGIHMTIWDSNNDYKLKIKTELETILEPYFDSVFTNYRAICQQFIIKLPGKETTFPVHQDWSIVNEKDYFSLNIWIPLQDVDEKNGAMWIVKGSHKLNQPIRGAGSLFPNYFPLLDEMRPYMSSYSMKAGEALIFYHSTIHGSPYNSSKEPRITIQTSIIPKQAPLEIYFQPPGQQQIEVHHPADDFYFHYDDLRTKSTLNGPTEKFTEIIRNHKLTRVSINQIKKIHKQHK